MSNSPLRFEVAPATGADLPGMLDCWNAALPIDGISYDDLERRVFLDASYDAAGVLVARTDDRVAGFCCCFVLLRPIEQTGLRPDDGFITMFGVHPDSRRCGIGSALLDRAEAFFRSKGRKQILIAPYTPNYFVPGLDKEHHATALEFLAARGYREYSEALAADANIVGFQMSEKALEIESRLQSEGIVVRAYRRSDLPEYLAFMRRHMPGPWIEDARRNLLALLEARFHTDSLWLACHGDESGKEEIIGFCQNEQEHFGPFGIADAWQGKGIGTVLLARTLQQMQRRGCHSAWVLWTGQRALDGIYGRLGFRLTRRFAIVKKELQP